MRASAFSLLFLLFFEANTSAMEIEHSVPLPHLYFLNISGEIVKGDCEKIISFIKRQDSFPVLLTIESGGGDVDEAMCLGRFVREAAVDTRVEKFCASACVLIWGAGVDKEAYELAVFGLHRPTFKSKEFGNLEPNQAQDVYRVVQVAFRDYMIEMDFPSEIIERMMATKSTQVDQVSGSEMMAMIGRFSPGYEEWRISKCGELTESEEADAFAAYWLKARQSAEPIGVDTDVSTVFSSERLAKAKRAESFSEGYRDYLLSKLETLQNCEKDAVIKMRNNYIDDY